MTALINDQQVLEILKIDSEGIRSSMNRVIKVPINKNQQLALLSLRYNIGGPAFDKSTLLRRLNERNYSDASMRFAEWRLSEGKIIQVLVNRRERERQLFSKPV
jgi:lysozyme